ncbi:MAG: apolipoprotein N-acyltransferase, partial [Thermoguttaceae bacterium]|nr:apolipoprotein N-acyltransferase [Thermoguttaceae bacterium]
MIFKFYSWYRKALRKSLSGYVIAIGSAFFLSTGWMFPEFFVVTWVGWVLFVGCVFFAKSHGQAFLKGSLIGFATSAIAFYWVPDALKRVYDLSYIMSWFLYVLMLIWECIPYGILGTLSFFLFYRSPRYLWGVSIGWVGLEYIWPRVFPWSYAYTQIRFLPLIQLAEIAGSGGISFILIAVSSWIAAFFYSLLANRKLWKIYTLHLMLGLGMLGGVVSWGFLRLEKWQKSLSQSPFLRVAVIQVDPSYQNSIKIMYSYSKNVKQEVTLVCWPESTLGTYRLDLYSFQNEGITQNYSLPPFVELHPTKGLSAELLAGGRSFSDGATQEGPFYQTAFLVEPDETIRGRYHKRALMPWGEYIPGQDIFPVFREWIGLADIFITGDDPTPLELSNGVRVGVLMCYEDMVPQYARDSVAAGADVLVSLINGSAFENPLALEQHFQLSLLRAVENRR